MLHALANNALEFLGGLPEIVLQRGSSRDNERFVYLMFREQTAMEIFQMLHRTLLYRVPARGIETQR